MKPFLTGRTQVKAANLQPIPGLGAAEAVARAVSTHKHTANENTGGPTVETIKQGDKVVRLIVTCSCGERIEIDCLYPPGG